MAVHGIDLNRLVALDALLSECSVSGAAARLHVSQPAMSATLAALREHFDDPLLINRGRSMRLSGFAQALQLPLHDLLHQARAISERRPPRSIEQVQRAITVVASDVVTSVLLAPLAARAATEAPGVQLKIRPVGPHLRDELDRGEVDVIVAAREALADAHPKEALFRMPFVCITWAGHPLEKLDISDYTALPHVSTHWPFRAFEPFEQSALKAMGLTRRVEVEVPNFSLMPAFLVNTDRVALVPKPLAEQMRQQWPLKLMQPPLDIAPLIGMIQWLRHQEGDAAVRWVIQTLHQIANELGLSSPTAN